MQYGLLFYINFTTIISMAGRYRLEGVRMLFRGTEQARNIPKDSKMGHGCFYSCNGRFMEGARGL